MGICPCVLAEPMHGRDAHATFVRVFYLDFFSVSASAFSVSSVAPPGHSNCSNTPHPISSTIAFRSCFKLSGFTRCVAKPASRLLAMS